MRNPTLREHPDAVGNGWELVNGVCKPVRYSKPPLPHHLNQHNLDVEDMDIDEEDTGLAEENSDLDESVDESDNETLSMLSEGELEYEDVDIGSDDGSSDEEY